MSYLRQITPWTRAVIGVLALAVAAVAVTVASASGEDSQDPESVVFGPDPEAFDEFHDCMSEHGVDVPEPFAVRGPGSGRPPAGARLRARPPGPALARPDSKTREAFEACADLMPKPPHAAVGFAGPPDPEALKEFRDCMSEHGAELPEPPKRPQGRALEEPSSTEREAFEACRDQLPEPPRGDCPAPGPPPGMAMPQD